jgi:site-specific recombinase XerD
MKKNENSYLAKCYKEASNDPERKKSLKEWNHTWRDELIAEFEEEVPEVSKLKDKDLQRLLPAILSREECRELVDFYKIDASIKDFRNHLIMRVFYATGVRIAELAEIVFADIDYSQGVIFIRSGKENKDRYVCFDSETSKLLRKALKEAKNDLKRKIIDVSIRQIRRIVEAAGSGTGISEKYAAMNRVFSAHSLRHAFASHCYENGMRLFTLKKLMGHEYLGTTEIYINTAVSFDILEYKRSNPFKKS